MGAPENVKFGSYFANFKINCLLSWTHHTLFNVYEDDVEKGEGAGNKQIFLKFSGKGQCHEIVYPYFVEHPTLAGTLINRLKQFFCSG